MTHACFVSFKKVDSRYKDEIVQLLASKDIICKSLEKTIDSDDIDFVIQTIRAECMKGTTVTLFLIGEHSSENEGLDEDGYNKQSFIIRELRATLADIKGDPRHGLLGIVLPEMESKVFAGSGECKHCGVKVDYVRINDDTAIREFHENYFLLRNEKCRNHYGSDGHFCVLCTYGQFKANPSIYIDAAYQKTKSPIAEHVHWRDIKHRGKLR